MIKKYAFKFFNANNKNYEAYLKLHIISTEFSEIFLKIKDDYHHQIADKLNDPYTSARSYWSISKNFSNETKISLILPILVNNKLISNLKESKPLHYFIAAFAFQCTPNLK